MSEEVKRYDVHMENPGILECFKDGSYVTFDDYAALRAKLVKAVIEIATTSANVSMLSISERIAMTRDKYGIRLRWTGDGFEEDKG